jgi:hypothetical protein
MRKAVMCAALLTLPAAGCTRVDADLSVQAVADHVSQTHYQTYHLDVENMGLGLYGGAGYDMGYRNRDAYEGPGSPVRRPLRTSTSSAGTTTTSRTTGPAGMTTPRARPASWRPPGS